MSARLVILVFIAGGLAVYFAVRPPKPASPGVEAADILSLPADGKTEDDIVKVQVADQPIGGKEPVEQADLHVTVEVDTNRGMNRLHFTVRESHGWYVDTLRIAAWKKGPGIDGPEDAAYAVRTLVNNYLLANDTYRTCTDLTLAEVQLLGGEIGRTDEWTAIVEDYGRAREQNPDPLPRAITVAKCD
jgi:hypothetical protein